MPQDILLHVWQCRATQFDRSEICIWHDWGFCLGALRAEIKMLLDRISELMRLWKNSVSYGYGTEVPDSSLAARRASVRSSRLPTFLVMVHSTLEANNRSLGLNILIRDL